MPPLEEMHHRLRNYSLLKESLHEVIEATLGSGPDCLKLEARYSTCKCVTHSTVEVLISARTVCIPTAPFVVFIVCFLVWLLVNVSDVFRKRCLL